MTSVVPVNSTKHKDIKIDSRDLSLFKGEHIIPLSAYEVAQAATDIPIVFVKNQESGTYIMVGILGLEPGENLFINDEGVWTGLYLPLTLSTYPFSLLKMGEQDGEQQIAVAIDEKSPHIRETEGEGLYGEGENHSDYFEAKIQDLKTHYETMNQTPQFIDDLIKHDLLKQQAIKMDINGKESGIEGIYIIDEEKLSNLPDEQFLNLRKRNMLSFIYALMASASQVRSLMKRKAMQEITGKS